MALRNQPYIPLYIQDYLTDEKLNECSAESQGVYIKIMCLMHKSREYGKILLKQNNCQISDFAIKLSKHLTFPLEVLEKSIKDLTEEDVLQIDLKNGILSQKRMIKDNDISGKRAVAGSKGGFAKAKSVAKSVANTENENENENENINKIKKVKNVKNVKNVNIPALEEFLNYSKTLDAYHPSLDSQIKAKYTSWVENKWRDGFNKPIKNWKTKMQNTISYFKKDFSKKINAVLVPSGTGICCFCGKRTTMVFDKTSACNYDHYLKGKK